MFFELAKSTKIIWPLFQFGSQNEKKEILVLSFLVLRILLSSFTLVLIQIILYPSVNTENAGEDKLEAEIEYEGGQRSTDVKVTSKGGIQYLAFNPSAEGRVLAKITMHGENIKGECTILFYTCSDLRYYFNLFHLFLSSIYCWFF